MNKVIHVVVVTVCRNGSGKEFQLPFHNEQEAVETFLTIKEGISHSHPQIFSTRHADGPVAFSLSDVLGVEIKRGEMQAHPSSIMQAGAAGLPGLAG